MNERENYSFALKYRFVICLITIIGTIFFSFGLQWLRVAPDLSSVSPKVQQQEPQKQIKESTKNLEKSIIIIFDTQKDSSLFSVNVLNAISQFHNEILFNIGIPRSNLLDIINTFNDFEDKTFTQDLVKDFEKQIKEAPFISDLFLSEKKDATILNISYLPDTHYGKENILGINLPKKIEYLVNEYSKNYPFLKLGIAGNAMVEEKITSYIKQDLTFLFPLSVFVIFCLLWIFMKHLTAAFLPLLVASTAVLWTLGFKGWLGSELSLVEGILPVILISIGCADGVHIMNCLYTRSKRQMTLKEKIKETMVKLQYPIILTGITTILGFFSLVTSASPAFRGLGFFMSFGIIVASIFSLWSLPALISYLPLKISEKTHSTSFSKHFINFFILSISWLLKYKKTTCLFLVTGFLLSLYSLYTINIDFDEVAFLKKSTDIRKLASNLQDNFGGYGVIKVHLTKKDGSSFKNLKDLQTLEAIENHLQGVPNTSFITSVNFIIKGINYKIRNQDPHEYKIVENPIILKQLFKLIDNTSTIQESLLAYSSKDWKESFISMRVKYLNSQELTKTVNALEPLLKTIVPDTMNYNLIGDHQRLSLSDIILKEQIFNLISTLLTISIVMIFLFRSVSNALIVVFPTVWATFLNFFLMKIMGIPLNPGTATVASIGMGVGIDYAIHYFSAFRRIFRDSYNYKESILEAVKETFEGISFNAIAVGLGFSVLIISYYEIIMVMSFIIMFTMATTAISAFTIIPVLLEVFQPKISFYNMEKGKLA